MVVVLALIGVAVLVTAAAPLLLARGSWRVRHPGVAIAACGSGRGRVVRSAQVSGTKSSLM